MQVRQASVSRESATLSFCKQTASRPRTEVIVVGDVKVLNNMTAIFSANTTRCYTRIHVRRRSEDLADSRCNNALHVHRQVLRISWMDPRRRRSMTTQCARHEMYSGNHAKWDRCTNVCSSWGTAPQGCRLPMGVHTNLHAEAVLVCTLAGHFKPPRPHNKDTLRDQAAQLYSSTIHWLSSLLTAAISMRHQCTRLVQCDYTTAKTLSTRAIRYR
ncbi:hypothetical protein C8Q80DRAFT_284566 [Daedaleopsis nitida]|nr:hypothetical protein C8Q80DRAFT_284566 [Daedaleopsis nitida]